MKKHFQIILATVLLGLMLSVVPAQAQPGRLISDIREDFNGLLVQLRTIDNSCVIILGALIDEARIYVLDSRKLITVNKGNLTPLLEEAFEDAQLKLSLAASQLDQCTGSENALIDAFDDELSDLTDEIADLDNIDVRKINKIVALLTSADSRVDAIVSKLEDVQADCIEDVSDGISDLIEELQTSSNGVSEKITIQPQLTESGPISFATLREFKIELGVFAAQLRSCLSILKEITKDKKWLLKALREVKELLRASNFGGRAAAESFTAETRVYSVSGKLIETQSNGLDVSRLANGVYLAVTGSQIRKVTVTR
jgi:hypothetical protein